METIFLCICLAVVIYALCKCSDATAVSKIKSGVKSQNVSEHIDRLNELHERLRVIDELIGDISSCSPQSHHKSISVEWISNSGKKNRYDICVDGKGKSTKEFLKYAYLEREKVRSEMYSETEEISKQCKETSAVSVKGERKYQVSKR